MKTGAISQCVTEMLNEVLKILTGMEKLETEKQLINKLAFFFHLFLFKVDIENG